MPFIWNDKTFWKRLRGETKVNLVVFIPLWTLNLFVWSLFVWNEVSLLYLCLLAVATASLIFTFINIFIQFPNANVPDTYSPFGKTLMYIGHFLIACLGVYIVTMKIVFV